MHGMSFVVLKVSMAPFVFSVLCGCVPLFEQMYTQLCLMLNMVEFFSDDSKDN